MSFICRNATTSRWNGLKILLTTGAILGIGLGLGWLRCGSLQGTIAALQGQSVIAEPGSLWVGDVEPGAPLHVNVRLRNLTAKPVRVIGGHSDCGCTMTDRWPLELPPGESTEVPLALKAPLNRTERFQLAVEFYLQPRARAPEFVLTGRVCPANPEANQVSR